MVRLTDLKPAVKRWVEAEKARQKASEEFFSAPFGGGPTGLFAQASRALDRANAAEAAAARSIASDVASALKLDVLQLEYEIIEGWMAQAHGWTAFHELMEATA